MKPGWVQCLVQLGPPGPTPLPPPPAHPLALPHGLGLVQIRVELPSLRGLQRMSCANLAMHKFVCNPTAALQSIMRFTCSELFPG